MSWIREAAVIEVKGLSKAVEGREIVSEISFLQTETALAVLGPSGSGKTTLFRLLLGLDQPDHGDVLWDQVALSSKGKNVVPVESRKFGAVFQDSTLFPHLTVIENVGFGISSDRSWRQQALRWLEKLGMKDSAEKKVGRLSGGERQRVCLAQALAPGPRLLLLDEPFNALDRLTRREVHAVLQEARKASGLKIILATHDARDAVELGANQVVILNKGRLVATGALKSLISSASNEWAREFIYVSLGGIGN
jgi:ABC-type Fe3+/spermidine/putrescine transport system ATPase subunit